MSVVTFLVLYHGSVFLEEPYMVFIFTPPLIREILRRQVYTCVVYM